jgi:subtilisin family serine protease
VAGTVGAEHNDAQVIGVSPSASLLSVKCLDPSTFYSCLRAVRYAGGLDSNGNVVSSPRARVVNMSWGWDKKLQNQCSSCVTTINTIMEEAWGRGLLLVAAAGNAGVCGGKNDTVGFPARLDKPLAVAATNSTDGSPCWSSTGPSLDLAAPGVSILSTKLNGTTTTMSGTSMATPHVSGAGALVWSKNSGLSNLQVRGILLQTAQDLSGGTATGQSCGNGQVHDTWFGCGLVRADLAVAATP